MAEQGPKTRKNSGFCALLSCKMAGELLFVTWLDMACQQAWLSPAGRQHVAVYANVGKAKAGQNGRREAGHAWVPPATAGGIGIRRTKALRAVHGVIGR